MENWVEVYEFNKKIENMMEWFFKLLDEEKIPHKEEIKEYWRGHKYTQYEQNILVYVPQEYKEKVESYLKEYNNHNNIIYEEAEELRNASVDEEEEKKEYERRDVAKKILVWIPIGMLLIIIICGIIIG